MTVSNKYLLSQKTFRTLLQAISHPGRVYNLGNGETETRRSLYHRFTDSPLFLVLQTLLDHEVTFNVCGHQREELEYEYKVIRATGSRTANMEDADFVIIPSSGSDGAILHAKRGGLEYPDTGATVIFSINSLSQIPPIPPFVKGGMRGDLRVTLKGPGINGEITTFIGGIKKNEFHYLKEINSEYPLGVDSIFIDAENRLMCIPRSTKIEVI